VVLGRELVVKLHLPVRFHIYFQGLRKNGRGISKSQSKRAAGAMEKRPAHASCRSARATPAASSAGKISVS
jgi:hypothetical protein